MPTAKFWNWWFCSELDEYSGSYKMWRLDWNMVDDYARYRMWNPSASGNAEGAD